MEHAFSILMGIFAGMILIYAALMALTKDYKILPYRSRNSVKPKNEKLYMMQLSKVMALVSLSPALCALTGLWNDIAAAVVLIVSLIVFIWLGTKIMRNVL